MVAHQIRPGLIEVVSTGRAKANTLPKPLAEPPGGLYPLKSSAWEMDEYRIMAGWPRTVPEYDIHVSTLVSGDGTLLAVRDTPTSLVTGAILRWVADEDYYDETSCRWVPVQGSDPVWESDPDHLPTLIHDYEYQVGEERFTEMTAINFDSDTQDYLHTDLSRIVTSDVGYTVIMVMSPNSVYGNDVDVPFNGLWCNPTDDPSYANLSVTIQGGYLYTQCDGRAKERSIALAQATRISRPSYLAMVISRPKVTFYLGTGPGDISSKQVDIGQPDQPINGELLLGKWPDDMQHNADLALFDLSIYPDTLSSAQIRDEFAALSGIYGGE